MIRHTRPPMTAAEAREIVAELKRRTSVQSQKKMLHHALGPIGNLSDDARAIYAARLAEMEGA